MWFLSIPGCFLSNLSSRGCSCCCLQLPGSPWMEHKHTLLLALLEGCWWFIHCETLLAETLLNTSLLCGCKNVLLCRTNACVGTHNSYAIERHFGAEHCWLSHSHGYVNMSWMSQSRFFFSPLLHLQLKWACCASENCKKWKDYSPNPSVSISIFSVKTPSILQTACW